LVIERSRNHKFPIVASAIAQPPDRRSMPCRPTLTQPNSETMVEVSC
jgi:hypothetical protein